MSKQPEALRRAYELENKLPEMVDTWAAAAELRRLQSENELLHKRCQQAYEVGRQSAQDDMGALLQTALEMLEDSPYLSNKDDYRRLEQTISAIRQHLENKA